MNGVTSAGLYFNVAYQIFNFQELTLVFSFFSYFPLLPLHSTQFHSPSCLASPHSSPSSPTPFHPVLFFSLFPVLPLFPLSPPESCSCYTGVISSLIDEDMNYRIYLLFIYFVSVFFCATFSVSSKLLLSVFLFWGYFVFCLLLMSIHLYGQSSMELIGTSVCMNRLVGLWTGGFHCRVTRAGSQFCG